MEFEDGLPNEDEVLKTLAAALGADVQVTGPGGEGADFLAALLGGAPGPRGPGMDPLAALLGGPQDVPIDIYRPGDVATSYATHITDFHGHAHTEKQIILPHVNIGLKADSFKLESDIMTKYERGECQGHEQTADEYFAGARERQAENETIVRVDAEDVIASMNVEGPARAYLSAFVEENTAAINRFNFAVAGSLADILERNGPGGYVAVANTNDALNKEHFVNQDAPVVYELENGLGLVYGKPE